MSGQNDEDTSPQSVSRREPKGFETLDGFLQSEGILEECTQAAEMRLRETGGYPIPVYSDDFRKDLENLINRHSMENGSSTPDFILANYLINSLKAFDCATLARLSHQYTNKSENHDEPVEIEDWVVEAINRHG